MIDFSHIPGGPQTRPHEDAERVARIRRPYLLEITRALISSTPKNVIAQYSTSNLVLKRCAEEIFLCLERNDFSSEAINAFNCALAQYQQGMVLSAGLPGLGFRRSDDFSIVSDARTLPNDLIFVGEQYLKLFADPIGS